MKIISPRSASCSTSIPARSVAVPPVTRPLSNIVLTTLLSVPRIAVSSSAIASTSESTFVVPISDSVRLLGPSAPNISASCSRSAPSRSLAAVVRPPVLPASPTRAPDIPRIAVSNSLIEDTNDVLSFVPSDVNEPTGFPYRSISCSFNADTRSVAVNDALRFSIWPKSTCNSLTAATKSIENTLMVSNADAGVLSTIVLPRLVSSALYDRISPAIIVSTPSRFLRGVPVLNVPDSDLTRRTSPSSENTVPNQVALFCTPSTVVCVAPW